MKFRLWCVLALIMLAAVPSALSAKSKHVTVTMNALNGSGQSGTATIARASGGNLTVTLDLSGEPTSASEPAHIHPGTCADLNPIPKAVLSPVVDGRSVTTIAAPTTPNPGARAIVVHKGSGADMKTYVSCGDIPTP
jgi:Cu/Zn superoxide dismutase